jgi:hypothetical protein
VTEIHACPPDGSGLTPCCGKTPFELPATDRMTSDPEQVTCSPTSGVTIDGLPAVVITIAELNALTASRLQAEAERDNARAALALLHEGEEPRLDDRVVASPAQWIWLWNRATPADRLAVATQIQETAALADAADTAEAAIRRVRSLATRWENALAPDRRYAEAIRAALDGPADTTEEPR